MRNSNKYNKDYFGGYTKRLLSTQSILDVFVLQGLLDIEDSQKLKKNLKTNRGIENFLLKNQLVTRETINKAYSIILKLPYISLKNLEISENAKEAIPQKAARRFKIVPFDLRGNILKLAVIRPADLLVNYASGIGRLLSKKNLFVELFITSDEDFNAAVSQYRRKSGILLKRSTLPIVFLRNRTIEKKYLQKIPKNYIEKYRLAVFDKSSSGFYMVACEKYDQPVTLKLLDFIRKENNVELELFATSAEDIDFLVENYENGVRAAVEKAKEVEVPTDKTVLSSLKEEVKETVNNIKAVVASKKEELAEANKPRLTVDAIQQSQEEKLGPNFIKLRNAKLSPEYLHQLPKEFVDKYRVIVFGESTDNKLMLATDSIDDRDTKKAIDFIEKQYPLKVFTTSASDFNYVLNKI